MPQKVDLNDIQGIVLREYNLGCAKYLFYRWETPEQGRQWLNAFLKHVTPCSPWPPNNRNRAVNIALTYQGLNALGLSPTSLASFPEEFRLGMANRAAILGDYGPNAPSEWKDEYELGSTNIHALVLIHGESRDVCKQVALELEKVSKTLSGVSKVGNDQDAAELEGGKEHFGFRDGVSQPWIDVEGLQSDNPDDSMKGGGKRTDEGWKPLEVGEFVLGYKDESGRLPDFPLPIELGRNGTYLVFRKLSKEVERFNRFLVEEAKKIFWPNPPDNAAEQLGALMMGRWKSGCPIGLSPKEDNPRIGEDPSRNNNFWYEDDPKGETCPLGAHIRRTNPREQTDAPGALGSNRHRIIRRGLHYDETRNDGKNDRGSVFIALNASISRQFEFLQRFWINNGEFLGLDPTDRDPIIGVNSDERDAQENKDKGLSRRMFTMPGKPFPVVFDLPGFVTVRGGDYFFVPSLTALNGLAGGAFTSFLAEYKALEARVSDPGQLALARKKLLWSWLVLRPKEMFDELREKQPIFQMPGYEAFGVSIVTIATKYADVQEILRKNNANVFSVKKYEEKMKPPRGPFILGMPDGQEYQRELGILQAAVPRSDLNTIVLDHVRQITDDIMSQLRPQGKLDVIQDLAWPVPLRLNGRYFGVSGPDEDTFKRWLRDIYTDLFLNLLENPEWRQKADVAVQQMNDYLNGLIDTLIGSGGGGSNTVLARLVQTQRDTDPGKRLDKNGIRRNIFGVTVGVVETNLKALARTVDQFLRRKDAYNVALQAIQDNDDTRLLQCIFEAMRFNPQNHVLFRWCEKTHVLAQGTTRATQIPANSLVFAATLPAMFDKDKIADPEKFSPGRPDDSYLFFGYELHECLGRYISPVLIREVIKRVLTLKNLRRAKNDQFNPLDLLPEHFMLEFEA